MKILISGYFGCGNIGDEAVLGGVLAGLRAELPAAIPVVLSGNPLRTRELHGVAAIPRMDFRSIKAELAHCDLFISGGGSLLQDVSSWRSPLYYLGLLYYAQRYKVPTMMLAQGIGPLRLAPNRMLTRMILNRTDAITLRDTTSAKLLLDWGIDQPPIEVTADTSFLLAPDKSQRVQQWWDNNIPGGQSVIAVALRRWPTHDAVERYSAIADSLAIFARQTNSLILFIPMQTTEDISIAREMSSWTPVENRVLDIELTPGEMLSLIEKCSIMLAMRLHALIFAVHRLIPSIALVYDPKVRDFAQAAHISALLEWEDIDVVILSNLLQDCWKQRELSLVESTALRDNFIRLARWNFVRVKELCTKE